VSCSQPVRTSRRAICAALLLSSFGTPQIDESARPNQHRVTSAASPAPEPGAELQQIPSLVESLRSAGDWRKIKRPELLRLWTTILGKLGPNRRDRKWFGDIHRAVVRETTDRGTYTRIVLDLPIEKDFLLPHLLLLPKDHGAGRFPAVICWTSTTPDYTAPEQWWGHGSSSTVMSY